MKKKNFIYFTAILIVLLVCIFILVVYKEQYKDKKLIKKFLREYYTIEEIIPDKVVTEDLIRSEMDRYRNFLDEECLEKFVNTRAIFTNKQKSYHDQFLLTLKKIDIQYVGKTNDDLKKYNYNIKLKLVYKDESYRVTSVKGSIKIKNMDNKPEITFFDYSDLK